MEAPRLLAHLHQPRHDPFMAASLLPLALQRRSDRSAILDDLEPYRGTDVAERSEIVSELCRHSREVLDSRADGDRVLACEDRRSPESEALWLRLVAAARRP
jgi:hypothetical protein